MQIAIIEFEKNSRKLIDKGYIIDIAADSFKDYPP